MSDLSRSPLWTAAEIAAATGGAVDAPPFDCFGVSINTRTLEPGDLFVALAGERDGHDFAEPALAKGAAAALVERPVRGPAIRVDDTLRALERMGEAARDRAPHARRAAVTGSVGKTSVTQAIAAALKLAGPSHNSVLSYNNHIGVPLTLARMPRETMRAVFEIGMNHADEITPLSKMVRPHVAVVTMVGPVHVENFPDGEIGVARAKAEIFDGMDPGGVAVLNADDTWFDLLSGTAKEKGLEVRTFGTGEGCDARLLAVEASGEGSVVVATFHDQALRFPIAQTGAHWGLNSLATLLAVEALDAPVEVAIEALAAFAPLAGRGAETRISLSGGEAVLIDESYNANPVLHGRGAEHARRAQRQGSPDRRDERHAGAFRTPTPCMPPWPSLSKRPRSISSSPPGPPCTPCSTACPKRGAADGARRRPNSFPSCWRPCAPATW